MAENRTATFFLPARAVSRAPLPRGKSAWVVPRGIFRRVYSFLIRQSGSEGRILERVNPEEAEADEGLTRIEDHCHTIAKAES